MFFSANTNKVCQTLTYMPNGFFSCQTTLNQAKFLELGFKNANLVTLVSSSESEDTERLKTLSQQGRPSYTLFYPFSLWFFVTQVTLVSCRRR